MVIRASRMHSSAAGEPDQTREKDSRCTANSPTRRPTESGPRSASVRVGSLLIGSGGLKVGGTRRLACVSQWPTIAFRCSLQQTLRIFGCEASEQCQERILRRSYQRFSTTRNHPLWRKVSRPQTEQHGRFVIAESIRSLCKLADAGCGACEKVWSRMLADGHRKHPLAGIEAERVMPRAGIAQPEMFAAPDLPAVAKESLIAIRGESFSQEQLAFA